MLINQKNLFNVDECQAIIDLNKTEIRYWNTIDYEYHSKGILYADSTDWIFDRLSNYFIEQTGTDIIKIKEEIHFHIFKDGDRFERHHDAKKNRVFGVGVLLNETFDGGDFIFYDRGVITIDKVVGNCYIFDVFTEHEVTPITNGIRYSLLWFLDNNNIKLNKTNLL
jgi:hypothetical protein